MSSLFFKKVLFVIVAGGIFAILNIYHSKPVEAAPLFNTFNKGIGVTFDTDIGSAERKWSATTTDTVPDSSTEDTTDQREYKEAPDFTLKTLQGDTFTLSDHEGKVVVINIWATWCGPCRKEIPDFIELQEEMKEKVLFVGVSVDEEGWKAVRPFARKYEFNYPLVVDNGVVEQSYGPFRGIPTTFIINKRGQVEYIAPGRVTKEMIKPALQELANR